MRTRLLEFVVPIAILAVFALLNLFVPGFQTIEWRVYDFFLHIKKPVDERPEILFVDIDDTAIEQVGQFPWSRDVMAQGLVVLSEFESGPVTFDIEYLEPSPLTANVDYMQYDLPTEFDEGFSYLRQSIVDLFSALQNGQISLADAGDFIGDLVFLADDTKQQLEDAAYRVAQNNDELLGDAAAFHGRAYFTVNLPEADELGEETAGRYDYTLARQRFTLDTVTSERDELPREAADMWPTIPEILRGAAGAGFPIVVVDDDGVRRRIDLFGEFQGDYYGQLVVTPFLDWVGNPEVTIGDDSVLLEGVTLPGATEPIDIEIQLAEDGTMLLNWPKDNFIDSFRHITYYRLVDHVAKEETLISYVRAMDDNELFQFDDQSENLMPLYDFAESLKSDVMAGGDRSQLVDWREYRRMFFDMLGAVLNGGAEEAYVDQLQQSIDSGELDEQSVAYYQSIIEDTRYWYATTRDIYDALMENRTVLAEEIPGSFIVIGWTGTGTSDIGVNPFFERYVNVGTHGAVVNTIMQQDFLDNMPWWIPFAIAAAVALLVTLIGHGLSAAAQLIIGFGAVVVLAGAGVTVFLVTGIYPNMVTPVAVVFLSFVTLTVRNFVTTAWDRARIKSTFGQYISKDVVEAVLDDPAAREMGGRNKELTAVFTDVQGFSTISEKLQEMHGENGSQMLGVLLNRYLTAMSNEVLAENGTIDKYEGDAIIAFFGAPVELDDCPGRACRAAIKMKKLEVKLNETLLAEQVAPSPLLTRIGINTGRMSVGNFGTEERRDFTIMGHHVNLAARLEGVNKQYGTWILVSEYTYAKLSPESQERHFTWRRLDRVRAVGMAEPVRLYELIDTREDVDRDKPLVEMLRMFNKALDLFEAREWNDAGKLFKQCLEAYPGDGPSSTYYKRCTNKKFIEEANKPGWDGVFNLTQK